MAESSLDGDVMCEEDEEEDEEPFLAMDPFAIGNAVRRMMLHTDGTEEPITLLVSTMPMPLLLRDIYSRY